MQKTQTGLLMRRAKRWFFFVLALLFLIEAWLWNALYPLVAKAVAWLPFDEIKKIIAKQVEHLPPWACVFIFIIPVIVILPFKLAGLWLLGTGHVFIGISTFVLAKLVSVGVAAFLFETCKEKLLRLHWCAWLYKMLIAIKAWSHRQIAPAKRLILRLRAELFGQKSHSRARLTKLRQHIKQRMKRY